MKNKILRFISLIIMLIALAMAWKLYDWKLVLIIFLLLWANNIESSTKEKEK